MTSAEFRSIREACELRQQDLAMMLGVSTRTVNAQEARDEVDTIYALALERIALHIGAQRGALMIAPANVRRDALGLAQAITG